MAKTISFTTVKNTLIRIKPNYTEDFQTWYPFALELQCVPVSDTNTEGEPVHVSTLLGSPQSEPYTNKELYDIIRGTTTLHTLLSNKLKDLYISAIDEDPSV